jgi:AcrR family transcriptional regulator
MNKENRYNEIILASIDVFSQTNYEKATTALIAKHAGVAEGTLYKYFPSKKELFLECSRFINKQMVERYYEVYKQHHDQPLDSLKKVAQSYLDFVRENPSMRKFLAFVLNGTFDEDFLAELKHFVDLNREATERMIKRAIEKGELRSTLDPHIGAWFFVGGYFTLIMMAEMDDKSIAEPDFIDKYVTSLLW